MLALMYFALQRQNPAVLPVRGSSSSGPAVWRSAVIGRRVRDVPMFSITNPDLSIKDCDSPFRKRQGGAQGGPSVQFPLLKRMPTLDSVLEENGLEICSKLVWMFTLYLPP